MKASSIQSATFKIRTTANWNKRVNGKGGPSLYPCPEIDSLTHDCIFVAHNVGFDYRMVQSAFKRHKMPYKRPTLCTVKLAQALIPSSEKYNLDHLCKSLNIDNTSRHRAMGSAAAAELLHLLIESHGIDAVMDHVEGRVRATTPKP